MIKLPAIVEAVRSFFVRGDIRMGMAVSSRELVRRVFTSAELPRLPFLPWVCSYAAKLEQISVRRMLTDPHLLAKALQNSQKLYGYDAVVNIFDSTLEAEACGCPVTWEGERELPRVCGHPWAQGVAPLDISGIEKRGRLPVVLEAARRLKIVLGRTVALAAVVTGPLTLGAHLRGPGIIEELDERPAEAKKVLQLAGEVALKICRAYGELEPDVIAVADSLLPTLPSRHLPVVLSVLRPIWSVTRFYDAHSILLTKGCTPDPVEGLFNLEADGVVASNASLAALREAGRKGGGAFGIAIPSSTLVAPLASLREYMQEYVSRGSREERFLSTEWEVPYDMPPENMHEIVRASAFPL